MEFYEILDKNYICPTRPYSDKELGEKRKRNMHKTLFK